MIQLGGDEGQMGSRPLPRMRVRRKPWNVARIAGRFVDAIAEIEAQREPWAQHWDEQNALAVAESGPLWLVLGDSVGQGIGASTPSNGFVPEVIDRLRDATALQWRVVNLAMTGARISHVVNDQLPAMRTAMLEPTVTTCMIGFNDFIGRTRIETIDRGGRELVNQVPDGTLFGRVGGPRFVKRSNTLARVLDDGAASGKIALFHPYQWTEATDVMARDRIHLNDRGYKLLANTIFEAIVEHGHVKQGADGQSGEPTTPAE